MIMVFAFELMVTAIIVFILIAAPIVMLFHAFRTIALQRKAKRRYPTSVADQHSYFKEHIYK